MFKHLTNTTTMKTLLLATTFFVSGQFLYAQESTKTLENGVIVHSSQGMEGPATTVPATSNQQRSISDWNLAECLDALAIIDLKCHQITPEECLVYAPYIQEINQRIQTLNQQAN